MERRGEEGREQKTNAQGGTRKEGGYKGGQAASVYDDSMPCVTELVVTATH